MAIFYIVYDIFLFLGSLIYLPVYALRGRVHSRILTRLGFFKDDYFKTLSGDSITSASGGGGVVWIHAVSVGEARTAESLIRLIRKEWPKNKIVISTVTPTGYMIVRKLLRENEFVFYGPIDISFVVGRFVKLIRPSLLIIMETEIWPNLIRLTKRSGARVVIVNGRISEHSYQRYWKIRPVVKNVLRDVDLFCTQSQDSAKRLISLGAGHQKVKVTGNIKFDISSDLKESEASLRLKDSLSNCLLLIAGSTHDNEEEVIVSLYKSLRKDFPALRLLIAPRHLERIDKVRRMIRLQGLEAVNLTHLKKFSSGQVVLLDTMGDLTTLYRLCHMAFVGGSLVKKGGHNPIEPALFGKPVIFGRYMDNFKEIRDIFIREKAAIEVESSQGLEYELRRLLAAPVQRQALGDRAKAILDKNRGAADRTFSLIRGSAIK